MELNNKIAFKSASKSEKMIINECRSAIRELDPQAQVILYGSRARGDANNDSDFDLLIVIDSDATLQKENLFRQKLYPIELRTGAVITIFLISKDRWEFSLSKEIPFFQNVSREGILL